MSLSNLFLRLAVVFVLIGVGLGYYMGATQNFAGSPVHAHVNLLEWVSMFLYGLFYRAVPGAAVGRLPWIHLGVAVAGFLVFMPALAVELLGPRSLRGMAEFGLIVGPTLVVIGMILFAGIVFRHTGDRLAPA